jgi:ATP/maltotriose-dependent transcriptional regulator MalT/DNA-binding SARP family transcriptional activator
VAKKACPVNCSEMHALPPRNDERHSLQEAQSSKATIDSAAGDLLQDRSLVRKIERPICPSPILHRAHLVAMLKAAIAGEDQKNAPLSPHKLVLLCAPAGYGKTTLLSDFATSSSFPCCWYFLERSDNDSVVFLRTLLLSLRQTFPHFGHSLEAVFTSLFTGDDPSSSEVHHSAADALCAALAAEVPERFALCICNYEEINENETLTDLVNDLLKKLSPRVTLVIESRAIPHIELVHLLAHGEMFGLNSDALRFCAQEISELARLRGLATLTVAEAEQLATSFDGWIAGILLGTHLGDFRALPVSRTPAHKQGVYFLKAKAAAAQIRKNLFTYVANEIFQRDPAIYHFLQAASVLQQMEAEMCNALLEISDADEYLTHLEQQGLFVNSYEDSACTIYTCLPVMRELLNTQLRQQCPARFLALHRRAAELWHARQNYEQAMYHALEAQAIDLAARFIVETYKPLLQQGHLDTVNRWLRALPPPALEGSARLLLIEATIFLTRGQYASASPLLDKALVLIDTSSQESDPAETLLLRAETNVLRGKALFQAGNYPQARSLCQQTLQHLPERAVELQAAAKMRIGICASLQGDFASGIVYLQEALQYWDRERPTSQTIDIHGALANTYYLSGNFALAEYYLTRALSYCEQLHHERGKIDNLIRKGILYTNQGMYMEAEIALLEALSLARGPIAARRGEAYALVNLGSLYLAQGKYTQTLALCEDGLALAYRWGNRSLRYTAFSNISMAYLLMGDPASALLYIEKIDLQPVSEQSVGYELAWRELTCGLILLYQQRPDEARTCLTKLEALLDRTVWRRELIQVWLRLAACEQASHHEATAGQLLEKVQSLLKAYPHYLQVVQLEVTWLPMLCKTVSRLPRLAHLRELLALEPDIEEETSPQQASSGPPEGRPQTPELVILAFGEPTVLLDGRPIRHWRMARSMELFFFLLETLRPVSKEQIITELWPDFDEQTNQTFHSTLHYLRKLFGADCVLFQAGGYRLNLAPGYGERVRYDVQEFQAYCTQARESLKHLDDTGARTALLAAVELYRGEYGRSFYSDWCTARRYELRTSYLEARRQLAQIAWRESAFDESTEHWRSMLRIDNCVEEAHLGLMQCYVRLGKRSAALRQYQYCQQTLQHELGIQPGSALQQFYQHVLQK